ncbi:MAG: hemerythrin family protein [Pseudomonadota bacterium]
MKRIFDPERVRAGGELHLAQDGIDILHEGFVDLLNRLDAAPAHEFAELFFGLLQHTREHFAREEALMVQCDFPAISEHCAEHGRVLGELRQMELRVRAGRPMMARAYVREQLPGWFELHTRTMDSALAGHMRKTGE